MLTRLVHGGNIGNIEAGNRRARQSREHCEQINLGGGGGSISPAGIVRGRGNPASENEQTETGVRAIVFPCSKNKSS